VQTDQLTYSNEAEQLFEMANLFPKHTGLPFVVWISTGLQHDVRVKVSSGPRVHPSEMISIAIRPSVHIVHGEMESSDLAQLTRWIELNRDAIIRYWNGELDTVDALAEMRPLA
jgi:hypothetical protein